MTEPPDIMKLHSGRALGDDGAPAMTFRFQRYITRQGPARTGTPAVPLTVPEAWGRLRVDYPRLAAAVQATVVHKLTVRAAAPVLGCSFKTVALHRNAGVAQLVVWTNLSEHAVARQVARIAP